MSPDTVVTVTFAPFLFAIFTAYWAQTTQRSALLWFLFGLILPPVAGLVLLWLNAKRHAQPPRLDATGRSDLLATRKDVI